MTSLIAAQEGTARWMAAIERSVAGSVHQGEMPFGAAPDALSGAGLEAPGVGQVAFRAKGAATDVPDEQRVNRAAKRGRLVDTLPMAPPRLFNAGSIFRQTSTLLHPVEAGEMPMAFVKPEIQGKEVQIASAFHRKEKQRSAPALPTAVAALVTNDTPDILATAYAPPEPDFVSTSPFASILRDKNDGRFIPPAAPQDHEWVTRPLPPGVFSEREQQCLAAGIYFEARGEPVRGQAAVAQVILNRVRNPAYPDTVCGVVYQNREWRNRCQFSFACDGIRERVRSPRHFELAKEVGMATTAGKIWLEEIGSSTHYHATYVRPRWAGAMQRLTRIGRHIFYRTYGGGWN